MFLSHLTMQHCDERTPQRPPWIAAGMWRRFDPLTRWIISTLAQSGLPADDDGRPHLSPDIALVHGTGWGSVHSTYRFAETMAAHGDGKASPTPFVSSIHSASAGALGELLGIHGPCTTVSQGDASCLAALRWADAMLVAGRAPAVLLVWADLHNPWSEHMVTALTDMPWKQGSGVAVALATADAGEREVCFGERPADHRLVASADARQRVPPGARHAAEVLGAWWPSCLAAAAAELDPTASCQWQEGSRSQVLTAWIGGRAAQA